MLKDYSDLAGRYYESVKSQVEYCGEIIRIEDDAELAKDLLQKRIDELTRDIERYETLRDTLVGNIDSLANELHRANRQVITLERSLRVARGKERKRRNRSVVVGLRHTSHLRPRRPSPANEFNVNRLMRKVASGHLKAVIRSSIDRLKKMDPYPLP